MVDIHQKGDLMKKALLLAVVVAVQAGAQRPNFGSRYDPNSVNNPYGRYGSPYSSQSANNPYATNAPRMYDQQGNYRGRLSANPYAPDSTSNRYGRYGSRYSPDSVNNPYAPKTPVYLDSDDD